MVRASVDDELDGLPSVGGSILGWLDLGLARSWAGSILGWLDLGLAHFWAARSWALGRFVAGLS